MNTLQCWLSFFGLFILTQNWWQRNIFSDVRLVHGRPKIQRMLLSAGTWSVFLMLNLM
ncbi:hypothetical protein ACHAW6_000804, partial [Cyclotella cf. meneghiniana]